MNRSAWLGPVVLGGWLIGWMALLGSSAPAVLPPIVYIGTFTPEDDRAYRRLLQAIEVRHPKLLLRYPVRYVRVSDSDATLISSVIAGELGRRPTLLITPTADTARIAAGLLSTTPVVFASHQHPVTSGIVDAMAGIRPQRMTGVSLADQWHDKRMELMREAFPRARSIAVLADRSWAGSDANAQVVVAAARRHGFYPHVLLVESGAEVDAAMTGAAAQAFDAWYIPATYIAYLQEARIIANLERLGAPAMHTTAAEVRSGGLLAYSADTSFVFDALSDLVARVCAGEDPAAIPIERPWRLVLSLRPRDEAGPRKRLPPAIIRRADEVL
jgi:putative tryptophan/tyrosine transport system substrate-binding protein